MKRKSYLPIADYGIIGNLQTAALVALDGSIDFMCFPRFDSPSVFCRLLDAEKGGHFSISPMMENIVYKQLYIPDTNVIATRFFSDEGIAEVIDFMPVHDRENTCTVIRKVIAVRGMISFRMHCAPRFNYAADMPQMSKWKDGWMFIPPNEEEMPLVLYSDREMEAGEHDAWAEFRLQWNESAWFILSTEDGMNTLLPALPSYIDDCYYDTIRFWQEWLDQCNYKGRWQDEVRRSVLTLKLLICHAHGSMVAAPTFSLPEAIGNERNWDYRYTWIRDAAFAMHAFLQLGFREEARHFIHWTMKQSSEKELQLMFAIDGSSSIPEHTLGHLSGYMDTKPVRIGNDAYRQEQMDIYGELLETVYLYISFGGELTFEYWQNIREYIDWVMENWRTPDHSIWEVRGQKREFLFTRMMCWVAMDRAIRIGNHFSYPFPLEKWHQVRDDIYYDIHENFWNEERGAFVQYRGGTGLDASALLMPVLRIISPESEKWKRTMAAIDRELRSDVMVFRYLEKNVEIDGLTGREGSFNICSFWHVECLALMGETRKAREHFEKMLGYANHLGLFSEQIGLKGEHLGNFPQAFTHLALISAAVQLDYNLRGGQRQPPIY